MAMLLQKAQLENTGDDEAGSSARDLFSNSKKKEEDPEYNTNTSIANNNDRSDESRNLIEQVSNRQKDISKLLKNDIYSYDLLWCLFVAAAKSYRFSSILRPFPPMYQIQDRKNMFALVSCVCFLKIIILINQESAISSVY